MEEGKGEVRLMGLYPPRWSVMGDRRTPVSDFFLRFESSFMPSSQRLCHGDSGRLNSRLQKKRRSLVRGSERNEKMAQ